VATPNLFSTYELLRRAMQQQSLQQQGADFGSTPNAAPEDSSDSYGDPQGGLLGRLLALQAEQRQYQPFAGSEGQTPSESRDPNFRQLSRAPITVRPLGALGPSNRSENQPSPTYSPAGAGTSLNSRSAEEQGAGLFGAYGNKPVAPWIVGSPMMTRVPVGWRVGGIPMPPMAPAPLPPIPMPAIPDQWKTAGVMLKLFPWIVSRMGGAGGDVGNDAVLGAENPALPRMPSASEPAFAALLKLFGHQMASRKGGDDEDDDRTTPEVGSDEWVQNFRKQKKAEARARDKAGREAIAASGPDPGNYCTNRYNEEIKECYERSHEYPDWDFLRACRDQAAKRLASCSANGGQPHPDEPRKWGPDYEEVFRNLHK
jgi:hypothetical protein